MFRSFAGPRKYHGSLVALLCAALAACGGGGDNGTFPINALAAQGAPIGSTGASTITSAANSQTAASSPSVQLTEMAVNTTARFKSLDDLQADSSGNLYILDSGRVREMTMDGKVKTVYPSPSQNTGDTIQSISKIALGHNGSYFVLDGNSVKKIATNGVVSTLAKDINAPSCTGTSNWPTAIAADATDSIYVNDWYRSEIKKISPTGIVSTFIKGGGPTLPGSGCNAGGGQAFMFVNAITFDKQGQVFFSSNDSIFTLDATGTALKLAQSFWTSTTPLLDTPVSVSVDSAGHVYSAVIQAGLFVEQRLYNAINMTTADRNTSLVAGGWWPRSDLNTLIDGQGSQARFAEVTAVVASQDGNLYVADRGNFAIRKVTLDGLVTTIAGAAAQKGTSD